MMTPKERILAASHCESLTGPSDRCRTSSNGRQPSN